MAFAQHTHENRSSSGGGSGMISFYNLSVRGEDQSPQEWFQLEGKQVYCHYEDIWFLNSLNMSPVVKYHETNGRDEILCAATFPESGGYCPACELNDYYRKTQITENMTKEQKSAVYKTFPIGKQRSKIILPVYVPRRVQQKHIYKGRREVLPIYWLSLRGDDYPVGTDADYLRLRDADEKYPISQNLYRLVSEPGVGKQIHRHFFPIQPGQNQGVLINHPLLTQWMNAQNPVQKAWDSSYHDMMECLPLLQFTRYVDANTKQPHDYWGYWEKAMQYYDYAKKNWPPCTVEIQPPPQAQGVPLPPHALGQAQPQMMAPAAQAPVTPTQWTPPPIQQPAIQAAPSWGAPGGPQGVPF